MRTPQLPMRKACLNCQERTDQKCPGCQVGTHKDYCVNAYSLCKNEDKKVIHLIFRKEGKIMNIYSYSKLLLKIEESEMSIQELANEFEISIFDMIGKIRTLYKYKFVNKKWISGNRRVIILSELGQAVIDECRRVVDAS